MDDDEIVQSGLRDLNNILSLEEIKEPEEKISLSLEKIKEPEEKISFNTAYIGTTNPSKLFKETAGCNLTRVNDGMQMHNFTAKEESASPRKGI